MGTCIESAELELKGMVAMGTCTMSGAREGGYQGKGTNTLVLW